MKDCYTKRAVIQKKVINGKPDKFWDFRMSTVISGEPLYSLTLDRGRTVYVMHSMPMIGNKHYCMKLVILSSAAPTQKRKRRK